MKKAILALVAAFLICAAGCSSTNRITQVSTINALLAGEYDGQITCGQLLNYGGFGIGTFDKLDGEMLVYRSKVYQIKADGHIYKPKAEIKTPFATVCNFKPENQFDLTAADYKTILSIIDEKIENQNAFVAVEIIGKFKFVKVRSVPAQNKPYPPLAKVVESQSIFEAENVAGSIVGFRCPPFVKGINVPGYHFHFISDDATFGGHILDLQLVSGKCRSSICNEFLLLLPQDGGFANIDLSADRTEELEKVEKNDE